MSWIVYLISCVISGIGSFLFLREEGIRRKDKNYITTNLGSFITCVFFPPMGIILGTIFIFFKIINIISGLIERNTEKNKLSGKYCKDIYEKQIEKKRKEIKKNELYKEIKNVGKAYEKSFKGLIDKLDKKLEIDKLDKKLEDKKEENLNE